jgi:hypothetical protein
MFGCVYVGELAMLVIESLGLAVDGVAMLLDVK